MKRILVLLIAFVYFAVSSGFTVHMHYCMGHFVDASFIDDSADIHACDHCGMTKKKNGNGCCNDQHKIVKSSIDHSLVKQVELPAPVVMQALLVVQHFPVAPVAFIPERSIPSFHAHAPPEPDDCPLFLKMRNLRI